MKQLLLFFLLLAGLTVSSQTLEHSYSNALYFKLSASEDAFCEFDFKNSKLNIYDTKHSLIKSISVNMNDSAFWGLSFVSKTLFNSDGKIKFGIGTHNKHGKYKLQIFNEDGVRLFQKDSASYWTQFINSTTGLKMVVSSAGAYNQFTDIYSIGGTYLGKKEIEVPENTFPYPNPTQQFITIPILNRTGVLVKVVIYSLAGLKVDTILTEGNLVYDASSLPIGEYFYTENDIFGGRFIRQ